MKKSSLRHALISVRSVDLSFSSQCSLFVERSNVPSSNTGGYRSAGCMNASRENEEFFSNMDDIELAAAAAGAASTPAPFTFSSSPLEDGVSEASGFPGGADDLTSCVCGESPEHGVVPVPLLGESSLSELLRSKS